MIGARHEFERRQISQGGRAHLVVLLAAVLLPVTAALGTSPESVEQRYAEALAALRARRCEEAEALFTEVLHATPEKLDARHGRGLSRNCLGEFDLAAQDLLAVAEQRPDDPQIALDLGAALTSAGAYREAAPWLRRAQASPERDGAASFLLGLGALQVGILDDARRSFARVREHAPELAPQAQYYTGVADYRSGQLDEAARDFAAVAASRPDTAMGQEARSFLAAIRDQRRARYGAYGTLAFEYDSNVLLKPTDNELVSPGTPRATDGRTTFRLGGHWVPWQTEDTRVKLSYGFFQSLHFRLGDFDIQGHQPSVEVTHRFGSLSLGLLASYDYFLRTRDVIAFVHQWWLRPAVRLTEEGVGQTEVYCQGRGRRFLDREFKDLDGYDYAAGVQQAVWLGDPTRYILLGYQFDREALDRVQVPTDGGMTTEQNPFSYDGHELSVGLGSQLFEEVHGALRYIVRWQDYSDASRIDTLPGVRRDTRHNLSVLLRRPFGDNLELVGGYTAVLNDSNRALFTYERHVGMLALLVQY